MGFQDRDYTRESSYTQAAGGWGPGYISPVVKGLIVANVVVFILQIFAVRPFTEADRQALWDQQSESSKRLYRQMDRYRDELLRKDEEKKDDGKQEPKSGKATKESKVAEPDHGPPPESFYSEFEGERICVIHEWFGLKPSLVIRGQIWRLLTHAFCHDRSWFFHILFNMLGLYCFGMTLESMYGSREFLLFYLTAAMFSGLCYLALDLYLGSDALEIGASGAIMGVLMLYAIHFPRSLIRIFFFTIEARWLVVIYVLFDLYPVLLALAGDQFNTGIAHAAHLGGLGFGFLYWRMNLRLSRVWDSFSTKRRQTWGKLRGTYPRIARPSADEAPGDDVDKVLAKLHESGVDSLTPEERRTLEQASERLRQKRS